MRRIIVYGSRYGTAQRYAEALSARTGIKVVSYTEIRDLADADHVIYVGSLYAGGVPGLSKTAKKLPADGLQKFFVVTVGLADPGNEENVQNIRKSVRRQIPEWLWQRTELFHLRGGINYRQLGFFHTIMMKALYSKVKKIPPEKRTAEVQGLIDTYQQTVDFTDFERLDEIMRKL